MRAWLSRRTEVVPVIGQWFTEEWMVGVFVYGGAAFDLFIVPLLLWPRTRLLALGMTIVFHLTNWQLFSIGIFPWLSLAATVLFFPPELPRRIVQWFRSRVGAVFGGANRDIPTSPAEPLATSFKLGRAHRIALAAISVYVAIQLFVPLRHHLYPGNVAWTEEGHPFSWRMKLRSKGGSIHFIVTAPDRSLTQQFNPYQYLTPRQVDKLAPQPDMIVQFSHYLADQPRADGWGEVEVYAVTMVSLNGREPQPMIDPTVNLVEEKLTLAPVSYTLPLTTPLFADSAETGTMGVEETPVSIPTVNE